MKLKSCQCCDSINLRVNNDLFSPTLEVWSACWWMGHYLSRFPKRHIAWANAETIGCLDLGTMCKNHMKLLASSGVKSARTYESGGRKRFVGTRHLKQSESLVFQFGTWYPNYNYCCFEVGSIRMIGMIHE